MMPTMEDPDGRKHGNEPAPKVDEKTGKVKKMTCNHTKEGVECPVHGSKGCPNIANVS